MKNNIWLNIIFWSIFVVALFASFWFRVVMPSEDLIHGNKIELADVDAYYHMMQADYVYANWPNIQMHSSLLTYPEGQVVGQRPLNGWLIGTIAKFGGMSVDFVGVYWPAILGILVLIPVLFVGWIVFNKWIGLITVSVLAVIQGEFYGRLAMGVSDQHALEVLLMCCFVLFYVLALKKNKWFAIGAGIVLGLYYFNWVGSPLLTIVILTFVVVQSIINRLYGLSNKNLLLSSFIALFVAAAIFLSVRYNEPQYVLVYIIAILAPAVIQITLSITQKLKGYWYPIILIGTVGACVGVLFLVAPSLAYWTFRGLEGLTGTIGATAGGLGSTISEVQPLLTPYGEFTLDLAWGCFGLTFLFGLAGAILLATRIKSRPEILFIWIWCIAMILVTLMQRRFGYYSAINFCLLSAYLFYIILNKIGWRKYSKKEIKKGAVGKVYFSPVVAILGVIVILVSMVIPSAYWTARESRNHPYLMTTAWREAVNYLKNETPETKDYGVLSWWDYGYWIAREGQRGVPCHPGGGNTGDVAKFLTANTTAEANKYADILKVRYVVIDYYMVYQKFYAVPLIADKGKLTEAEYNDTQVVKMFFSEKGTEGYKLVFESSTKYEGKSQVRIYERYAPLVEPCNCGG
jgi:oligosaccharyl transferase (archaeosortase A-associated)